MWKNTIGLNYGKQDDIFIKELMKTIPAKVMDDKTTITYENNKMGEFVITIERRTNLPDYKFPYVAFAGTYPIMTVKVEEFKGI